MEAPEDRVNGSSSFASMPLLDMRDRKEALASSIPRAGRRPSTE